ncbi:MAG: hypothetical protein WCV91_03115 [Candidatus Margulisiibacteriota bacterium]
MKIALIFLALVVSLSSSSFATAMLSGEKGAKQLINNFINPNIDHLKLTKTLHPDKLDYKAFFIDKSWEKAMKVYEETLWTKDLVIEGKEGQTKILIWSATPAELKAGTGNSKFFPGGYRDIADQIRPQHTIYRFKLVEPGDTSGRSFDGLVYLNGHWVIFPKPWKALNAK